MFFMKLDLIPINYQNKIEYFYESFFHPYLKMYKCRSKYQV